MLIDVIIIAVLCIVIGAASIPVAFTITHNPGVVWAGNALGSIISAAVVIYVGKRITDEKFKEKARKHRLGKKIVNVFDATGESKKVQKTGNFINRHGLKIFSLCCPIFPGVLASTAIVFALDLNRKTFIRWMLLGVFLVSGAYVLSYWWTFVRA